MTKEELKRRLKSSKYGFPYFRMLLEKGIFFNSSTRLDIERHNSDTFLFKKDIAEVFEIKDSLFRESYDAVVNGEGNEIKKIKSIRSSSLLGLLAFYKVHSGKRIKLQINIDGTIVNFVFSEVVFEKTNRVFHPSLGLSSIDIALYGTANGEACVLYLESKFTEYLERKDMDVKINDKKEVVYPISSKYSSFYKQNIRNIPGLSITVEENKGVALKSSDEEQHYCEGIKQMVSHYIGAQNSDDRFKGLKVFLGTILFDFSVYDCNVDKNRSILDNYSKMYMELAKRLNSLGTEGLYVFEKPFTYQDFFSNDQEYRLDKAVKEYYQL